MKTFPHNKKDPDDAGISDKFICLNPHSTNENISPFSTAQAEIPKGFCKYDFFLHTVVTLAC